MVLVVHYGRVGPFGTVQADKGALCDDKPGAVPRSVGVMFDVRMVGLFPSVHRFRVMDPMQIRLRN